MGIFFKDSKKIYRKDFQKTLKSIPKLSPKEKEYVKSVFDKSLRGGLSEYEVKKEISRLKHNSNDPLSRFEVKKLKKKLGEHFKK
jgi:hypothetical protein